MFFLALGCNQKEGYNNVRAVRVNEGPRFKIAAWKRNSAAYSVFVRAAGSLAAQDTLGQLSAGCRGELETDREIQEQTDMGFHL